MRTRILSVAVVALLCVCSLLLLVACEASASVKSSPGRTLSVSSEKLQQLQSVATQYKQVAEAVQKAQNEMTASLTPETKPIIEKWQQQAAQISAYQQMQTQKMDAMLTAIAADIRIEKIKSGEIKLEEAEKFTVYSPDDGATWVFSDTRPQPKATPSPSPAATPPPATSATAPSPVPSTVPGK